MFHGWSSTNSSSSLQNCFLLHNRFSKCFMFHNRSACTFLPSKTAIVKPFLLVIKILLNPKYLPLYLQLLPAACSYPIWWILMLWQWVINNYFTAIHKSFYRSIDRNYAWQIHVAMSHSVFYQITVREWCSQFAALSLCARVCRGITGFFNLCWTHCGSCLNCILNTQSLERMQ